MHSSCSFGHILSVVPIRPGGSKCKLVWPPRYEKQKKFMESRKRSHSKWSVGKLYIIWLIWKVKKFLQLYRHAPDIDWMALHVISISFPCVSMCPCLGTRLVLPGSHGVNLYLAYSLKSGMALAVPAVPAPPALPIPLEDRFCGSKKGGMEREFTKCRAHGGSLGWL